MANKTSVRAQVKELTDRLAEGVRDLFSSDKYMDYLRTMSRFHTYSTRNIGLIHMQMPSATHVAGFRSWQKNFERHVKKGEKGIRILAPTPYTIKREEQARDPETREFLFDDEGLPVTEEVEVHIPRFKVISVFDVSQTDGKPLPTLAEELTGDVRQYNLFMDALRAVSPLPIRIEALPPDTDGECRQGDSIAVREGMSETQTILTTIHEISHALLHDNTATQVQEQAPAIKDRATREVEAESVSYAVCAYYGIETSPSSFGYLASWSSGKGLRELNASLDVIRKTSAQLIEGIDTQFRQLAKERGIDLAAEIGIEDAVFTDRPGRDVVLQFARDYVGFMNEIYQDGFVDGGPDAEQRFVEDAATRILAGDTQDFAENLMLAYEKDEDGEPLGPDPAAMLARLQAFSELREPEQAQPALPEAELARLALERLEEGDLVFLPGATSPLQFVQLREEDVLFVAPELGIDVMQTHEQVRNALLVNEGNRHLLDAAALPVPDLAPNQEIKVIDGVNFVYTNVGPTQEQRAAVEASATETAAAQPEPQPAALAHLPDPAVSLAEQEQYGYTKGDMLPMRQERALELFDMDYTVFMLHPDNTEEMVFDRAEIEAHTGMFGLEENYWYESPEYYKMRGDTPQAAPQVVDARTLPPIPGEPAIHERLDAITYKWDGPGLEGLAPREVAAALIEWQQSNDAPIGAQEAHLLTEYAVATGDARLTKDLAEYLGRAGFERTFGELNPAVEQDVRGEMALWEKQDPVFMLARDINQYYNDIDLYHDGRPFTRWHNRDSYRELLEGATSRTLSWLRAHIEPMRVERASALIQRIEALDLDTPYRLAEDIHAFITAETGTEPTRADIAATFAALRYMDRDAVATLEIALRVSGDNEQIVDKTAPAELLGRLNDMRNRHTERFAGEPMVKVTFTESPHFIQNQLLPLSVANELYRKLDAELHGKHEGYDKTDFSIFYTKGSELQQYNGQYSIGDGDGGLTSHIAQYAESVLSRPDMAEQHEDCRDVYNHLVPYLMYHCEMAARENQAETLLADYAQRQSVDGWKDLVQSARLLDYVSQCRQILNTKPDDTQFPALPLPGEVDALGEQVANMPLSEDAKDYILQNNRDDVYAIYQVRNGGALLYHRYARLEELHEHGDHVQRDNYAMKYMLPIPENDSIGDIIHRFNLENHPKDYTGRTLSTSDVLVFNMGGDISAYYLNGHEVVELPHFTGAERNLSLRLAEDIDAFLYDYGKTGQHSDVVNDGPVKVVGSLELAIEGKEPALADIGAMLRFVAKHDTDDAQRSKAGTLLSRLEAFNPPRHEEPLEHKDQPELSEKPSLLARLQQSRRAVDTEQNAAKTTPKHNNDREV